MYPGRGAAKCADKPAFIMAETGEAVSYAELEARSNRLAHLLRARGLRRLDHYAIFMENNARYLECCAAGVRAGLYYTCVNSFLTPNELAYILKNSESKILITSQAKRSVALAALAQCPKIELCLIADGPGEGDRVQNLDDATSFYPSTPIADELLGAATCRYQEWAQAAARFLKCCRAQTLRSMARRSRTTPHSRRPAPSCSSPRAGHSSPNSTASSLPARRPTPAPAHSAIRGRRISERARPGSRPRFSRTAGCSSQKPAFLGSDDENGHPVPKS